MTVLADSVRPYNRLDRFDKTYVDSQIEAFFAYIGKTYIKPTKTLPRPPVCVQEAIVAMPVAAPEPEIDFIPPTNTQKRTRQPRKRETLPGEFPLYDKTLKERIAALIAERGPVISADIVTHFNMPIKRASVVIDNMQKQKRLFVVGYTKNPRGQLVKVLHTDPNFVYVQPEPEVAAEPIVEEKRPARIPSLSDVDRGRALVANNFSRNSIAHRAFDLICLRPRSMSELEAIFRCGNSSIKTMMSRMESLGIVERVGHERNVSANRIRILFGVVEAEAAAPPRVPPSAETIAKGQVMIKARCGRHGGKTLDTFNELCAHGPLNRNDLTKRLDCHCTMIDIALRTLDTFGLVVVVGKVMDPDTGKMCRLWDVKPTP